MGIVLHPAQSRIFGDLMVKKKYRHIAAACARGFGKSYCAGAIGVAGAGELLKLDASVPHKLVVIMAPTHSQVIDIYYPLLAYEFGLAGIAVEHSRAMGYFRLPKNVEIRLVSFEAVERLRGIGIYLFIQDEISSYTKSPGAKSAFEDIIEPCIITRWSEKRAKEYGAASPGRSVTMSTPKGFNYLHEMSVRAESDPLWGFYQFDYTHSPYLDPNEIERLRHTRDPITFASEYRAQFKESGNSVFYCFDRTKHVLKDKDFEPVEPHEVICAAIDFNVGRMATSLGVIRGKQVFWFDELEGSPDTEQLAIKLTEMFPNQKIVSYPDPSGRSRKTSATVGRTDFTILESYGIACMARRQAPGLIDSANCVNRMLMTAAGEVSMYFHERCKGLIKSIERTSWLDKNPDTAAIDKSANVEHYSDGVRYFSEYEFPIAKQVTAKRGKRF